MWTEEHTRLRELLHHPPAPIVLPRVVYRNPDGIIQRVYDSLTIPRRSTQVAALLGITDKQAADALSHLRARGLVVRGLGRPALWSLRHDGDD